jgi:hypothetical protein
MTDPIAFATTLNPDTLYLHEAMGMPDREKFHEAMACEVQDHKNFDHWELSLASGRISVHFIPSVNQQGDIANKPFHSRSLPNFTSSFLDGNLHDTR